MEPQYTIYFSGQVLEGHDVAVVRENLSRLFKADQQTLDRLFSGKAQVVKRGCDKPTALQYKQAMERAGAVPVIKAVPVEGTVQPAAPAAPKPVSAAEKIAALAAAADPQADAAVTQQTPAEPTGQEAGEFDVAPAGADVLRPDERPPHEEREIDTSGLNLGDAGQRLSEQAPPPPEAPATDHLAMGEVGEDIPNLPATEEPLSPDTDALQLSADGWDLSDCAPPEPEVPPLDLSGMDLAPEGADVLEEEYRRKQQPAAPDTDHISLSD